MRSPAATRALVIGALAACVAATTAPRTASADEPSAAVLDKAREQFRKALSLEVAGNYEAALAMFKEVALIKSTPQVRFHIGSCEEKMGDWVQAIGSYRLALHEAQQASAKDVTEAAGEAIATLEPKIPKLTITRGDGAQVASVQLDGRALGGASVGTAMSVNPGPHVIKATAPGREPIQLEMTVAERETKKVELVLPAAPEAPTAATGALDARGDSAPSGPSAMKVAGFVTAGVGVVSLGVSGVFFLMRQGAISDLDEQCGADGQQCPADAQSTFDSGQTYSTVATVTFVGGLGALALGTVLILAAPKSPPKRVGLVAGVTAHGASAALIGKF